LARRAAGGGGAHQELQALGLAAPVQAKAGLAVGGEVQPLAARRQGQLHAVAAIGIGRAGADFARPGHRAVGDQRHGRAPAALGVREGVGGEQVRLRGDGQGLAGDRALAQHRGEGGQHQEEDHRLNLEVAIAQPAGVVLVRRGRPGGPTVDKTEPTLGQHALLEGPKRPWKDEERGRYTVMFDRRLTREEISRRNDAKIAGGAVFAV
jgi:hypothetical protein